MTTITITITIAIAAIIITSIMAWAFYAARMSELKSENLIRQRELDLQAESDAEAEQLRNKLARASEKFGADERRADDLQRLDRRISLLKRS